MIILVTLLGLCLGSFIYAAYSRFCPTRTVKSYLLSITISRSCCPHCQQQLAGWQLIPLLSWCYLKGRCYYCQQSIKLNYLAIELLTGALFLLIVINQPVKHYAILLMILACWFILLSLIDFKYYLLPDFLTQPLMWFGIIMAYLGLAYQSLESAIIGVSIGYLLLKIPAALFYLCYRKSGLGQGDIKLLAALGAWIPYLQLPWVLMVASSLGICYYMFLRSGLAKKSVNVIAFGPFLMISGFVMLCFFTAV